MLRYIPFLMLIVPLTEIAVFILVGQWIGVLPTIALVILTAIAGASLLRHQGLGLALKIRKEMEAGRAPGRDLANGAMMLIAGVLLLTPGFVTDTLGFLLFIPQVRARVFEFLAKRIQFVSPQSADNRNYGGARDTIDLGEADYERRDDEDSVQMKKSHQTNPDSPWNREN
ncbi:MAG: FxsA family protein [Notoacmeibacter sp.]